MKPTGKLCVCVDMTHLNDSVEREQLILPVDKMPARLEGATVFTKLDAIYRVLASAPTQSSSQLLSRQRAGTTFERPPFGISSAPEHFQKRISQLIDGIDGVLCHADDLLVTGKDCIEHNDRLHKVLTKFREAGRTLNDKCKVATTEIKFLRHVCQCTKLWGRS